MKDQLDIFSIYEQNLNFLFGAGASYGFLPTLALNIKDKNGISYTFETLAKYLDENKKEDLYALLFMCYYKQCIRMGLPGISDAPFPPHRNEVIDQYKLFLRTLLKILDKQNEDGKKCNIYTTNYDNCFELATDDLITEQSQNFVVNDGSSGFQSRFFHTKNFNNRIVQKGIFDRHAVSLPQLNLLHAHGSVNWKKDGRRIGVDYGKTEYEIQFSESQSSVLSAFGELLEDSSKNIDDLIDFDQLGYPEDFSVDYFLEEYKKIPIVNPTKWKFHETVFEEAYYQILRHLSFELERPNSVLITFGFSFADEHILHLVQRSLSNPSLTVYISCYNDSERDQMKEKFRGYPNVKYITIDDDLNFSRFNRRVFTLKKDEE